MSDNKKTLDNVEIWFSDPKNIENRINENNKLQVRCTDGLIRDQTEGEKLQYRRVFEGMLKLGPKRAAQFYLEHELASFDKIEADLKILEGEVNAKKE